MYMPTLARFTARDPIMAKDAVLIGGVRQDAYAYVKNNPINRVDPSGEFCTAVESIDIADPRTPRDPPPKVGQITSYLTVTSLHCDLPNHEEYVVHFLLSAYVGPNSPNPTHPEDPECNWLTHLFLEGVRDNPAFLSVDTSGDCKAHSTKSVSSNS